MQTKVTEFIDDMAAAYAWADVLVCRSGAMTIAECCAAGKAALFIPYPFSAGDHQVKNAQAMVDIGAAIMLTNTQLEASHSASSDTLINSLTTLINDRDKLITMGKAATSLYKPQALQHVATICEEYLNA